MSIHDIAFLIVGISLGGMAVSIAILIRDARDMSREVNAWLDYEKEERRGWKETKTQKERKARASWN